MAEHLQKAKVSSGAKVGTLGALQALRIPCNGRACQNSASCQCPGAKNFVSCEIGIDATDLWVAGEAAGLEAECFAKVAMTLTMRQWLAICLPH